MTYRYYEVVFDNVAITVAQDLFEIGPAANKPCYIAEWSLSQSTELGDAQEEDLRIHAIRGYTASGSGGSSFTPNPRSATQQAAGFAAEINNTTLANTGTPQIKMPKNWNLRQEELYMATPEPMIEVINGTVFVLRLVAAPADSVTMSGYLIVAEAG